MPASKIDRRMEAIAQRGQSPLFRKLRLTLGVLLLCRLGLHLPLPGLDPAIIGRIMETSEGAFMRISLFALGVGPLFAAMTLAEIAAMLIPPFRQWQSARIENAEFVRKLVLGASLLLAGVQGAGVAMAMERVAGLVVAPGLVFRIEIALTFAAATALLSWLAQKLTINGFGEGFWMLFAIPVIAGLPDDAFQMIRAEGTSAPNSLAHAIEAFVLAIGVLVAAGLARRKLADSPGAFAPKMIDVWPALLGTVLASYLTGALRLATAGQMAALDYGAPLHLALVAVMIGLVAYVRSRDDQVSGLRPIWPLTLAQIFVCVGAEALTIGSRLPVWLDGAGLVVAVAVMMSWLPARAGAQLRVP